MARAAKGSGAGAGRDEGGSEPPSADLGDAGRVEPAEVAEYIESMTAELVGLARGARLDFLAHLLDMARAAAAEGAGASRRPRPER